MSAFQLYRMTSSIRDRHRRIFSDFKLLLCRFADAVKDHKLAPDSRNILRLSEHLPKFVMNISQVYLKSTS